MQAANFKLTAARYLAINTTELDLHNDYEFVSLKFDVSNQVVELIWCRCASSGKLRNLPQSVSLRCEGVTFFLASPADQSLPISESLCLSSIGYQSNEIAGQFWVEEEPDDQWAWSIQFQSGAQFQIRGSQAYAKIEP